MESRAAVFREAGVPVSIERILLDSPGPSEVPVRIAAAGLCRTDLTGAIKLRELITRSNRLDEITQDDADLDAGKICAVSWCSTIERSGKPSGPKPGSAR
jgi:Zn-dependent alcohol dehydrogenase